MKLKDLLQGSLKDWTEPPKEKRWSGAYGSEDGLTEFERRGGKDFVNEASMNIGKGNQSYQYKSIFIAIDFSRKISGSVCIRFTISFISSKTA